MKVRFIGDVHGKFESYKKLLNGCDASIQVGDFGVGFGSHDDVDYHPPDVGERHRFVRGNHDNPAVCATSPSWIRDGHYEDGMFFLGGERSIDKAFRTEGVSWWEDEECDYPLLSCLINYYGQLRPEVVVSHGCPEVVARKMCRWYESSRTMSALSAMFVVHKPKLWVFGHWHRSLDVVIEGTRFKCLNELETFDLEM